jgi:predicted Zn-dependent peptidase
MKTKKQEIKQGIKLHTINTNRFKTNLVAIFLTTPITRENVTFNSVLSSVLRRGTKNMPTQEQISKELENMYGASFDCGIDKTGDNHILKFYLESINDKFLPQTGENMLKQSIEKLLEIVFNPLVENGKFKEEYVEQEKSNIKRRIEGKIDNKAKYAIERCIEEMYKDEPYGLYRYGYVEDLDKIDATSLYQYYQELINTCKIDISVSGKIESDISSVLINNENIRNLNSREPEYVQTASINKETVEERKVSESMDVTQGKLIIGMDINIENEKQKYKVSVYNALLGGSATSKLFQEVREKASLAYSASSNFIRHKGNIIISCGIEIKNYDKALEIIRKQIEDMKDGNFTDEDLENSKKGIISAIKGIEDEQDTEITYYFGQELSGNEVNTSEYIEIINQVTKEDVIDVANSVNINTIYFLKD